MRSTARRYGAAIALVSGGYSLWAATGMRTGMGTGMGAGWADRVMLALGVVVVVHGLVLVVAPDLLGSASGPLMVGWSILMLLNQVAVSLGGMGAGMGGRGVDAVMVLLAMLMLVSGVVMTREAGM
ncbi:MAG: hypothetical protein ABEJ06_02300 [Haloarculaceae archaeon]